MSKYNNVGAGGSTNGRVMRNSAGGANQRGNPGGSSGRARAPASHTGGDNKEVPQEGVYVNEKLMHILSSLIGCNVEVNVRNGEVFEGIFKTFSQHFEVVLLLASKKSDNGEVGERGEELKTMIIRPNEIITIEALNVDLDYAVTADSSAADVTTGSSSGGAGGRTNGQVYGRELTPWDDGTDEGGVMLELEDHSRGGGGTAGWNALEMFRTNREKFNVGTTFDADLSQYTTRLTREDTAEYREREKKAEMLAAEIERTGGYRDRAALENGDNEQDEEMAFSAVHRPNNTRQTVGSAQGASVESRPSSSSSTSQESGSSTAGGKYLPPHLRGRQNLAPSPVTLPNQSATAAGGNIAAVDGQQQQLDGATAAASDSTVVAEGQQQRRAEGGVKGTAASESLKEFSKNFILSQEVKRGSRRQGVSPPLQPTQQPVPGTPPVAGVEGVPQVVGGVIVSQDSAGRVGGSDSALDVNQTSGGGVSLASGIPVGGITGIQQQMGQQLIGQHLVGQHLIGQQLVGQQMVGQQMVGQQMVGQQLVGQQLVGQQLVGQQLVGQQLVGQQLVGQQQISLANPQQIGQQQMGQQHISLAGQQQMSLAGQQQMSLAGQQQISLAAACNDRGQQQVGLAAAASSDRGQQQLELGSAMQLMQQQQLTSAAGEDSVREEGNGNVDGVDNLTTGEAGSSGADSSQAKKSLLNPLAKEFSPVIKSITPSTPSVQTPPSASSSPAAGSAVMPPAMMYTAVPPPTNPPGSGVGVMGPAPSVQMPPQQILYPSYIQQAHRFQQPQQHQQQQQQQQPPKKQVTVSVRGPVPQDQLQQHQVAGGAHPAAAMAAGTPLISAQAAGLGGPGLVSHAGPGGAPVFLQTAAMHPQMMMAAPYYQQHYRVYPAQSMMQGMMQDSSGNPILVQSVMPPMHHLHQQSGPLQLGPPPSTLGTSQQTTTHPHPSLYSHMGLPPNMSSAVTSVGAQAGAPVGAPQMGGHTSQQQQFVLHTGGGPPQFANPYPQAGGGAQQATAQGVVVHPSSAVHPHMINMLQAQSGGGNGGNGGGHMMSGAHMNHPGGMTHAGSLQQHPGGTAGPSHPQQLQQQLQQQQQHGPGGGGMVGIFSLQSPHQHGYANTGGGGHGNQQ